MFQKNKSLLAIQSFHSNRNCAQSVISAFYQDESLLRALAGFGGGMGMSGNICGAVTGGIAVLGMLNEQSLTNRDELYSQVQKMTTEFEKKFGSLRCDAITKIKHDPDVLNAMKEDEKFCDRFVVWATNFIEDNTK